VVVGHADPVGGRPLSTSPASSSCSGSRPRKAAGVW
jgi:hypothetical protein